jgi:hypothetical protein
VKKLAKLGRVHVPDGTRAWARSHALLPTPIVLDEERIRVYFASLDENAFGRPGFVDVARSDPTRVLYEHPEPVMELGPLGTFDDSGITPSCVLHVNGELWMYYVGWQRSAQVPYLLFTGLAISRDGGVSFERHAEVPVIDRSASEPYSRGAPFVRRTPTGEFHAWYWTSRGWSKKNDVPHYNNDVCFLASHDGKSWGGEGAICVPRDPAREFSIGRPWVVQSADEHWMWFTVRSHEHADRAGFARSCDGTTWTRDDTKAGISTSRTGWDSEMICYPAVVHVDGRLLMFHNGNRHGMTGFGLASSDATAGPLSG